MALHDYGATLAYSDVDSGYTTFAGVISINGSEDVVTMVKAAIIANITHKKLAGCIELGDWMMDIEFEKTIFNTVNGFFTGRSTKWWKITDIQGNIIKGRAVISKRKHPDFGKDDRMIWRVTLTPTDADWTFTAA